MSEVHVYNAAWVVPVTSPPVPEGAVAVSGGRVVDAGKSVEMAGRFPGARTFDLGESIVLPGLTNAHTHLSLTALPDSPPPGTPALGWLERVARAAPGLSEDAVRASVREGVRESLEYGTALVGDIAPGPVVAEELSRGSTSLAVRVFFEFLGVGENAAGERFRKAAEAALDSEGLESLRYGLSPHAPYSVPGPLWKEAARFTRDHDLRWTTHLGEMPAEAEFLESGTGPMLDFFRSLGVWDGSFPVPGTRGVGLLEREDALDGRMLLVHGVHLTRDEIRSVAEAGAFLCLCPRSNAYLDLPPPPVERLLESGVRLCLGTDSRASCESLSIWAEMRALHALAPDIPAARLLEMATVAGAEALGMTDAAGSIQPGTAARLITVPTSGLGGADPVEYLVHETLDDDVRGLL